MRNFNSIVLLAAAESNLSSIPQLLHEKVANLFELYLVDYNNLSSQMEFLSMQMQNAEVSYVGCVLIVL